MFYSQFILAKKGQLGTIWIAAHLERKLRKNQVADTDIGVSVDSILFPDVPIALRLSSHLLLGVVRIYNRKVNYLFDDCSEALLKVKQAFRSSAVDLPSEESKAPYHSITLPETFDLDDFELPDNEIFKGNYVDHHISSREQITLQDTMEGVHYSISKFGLDERFGDGYASQLDLDEELLLDKIGTTWHADESVDPQAADRSMSPPKQDEHPEDRAANSEIVVDDSDEHANLMDYAQAPCIPRLVDEPNLSIVQGASACDDHMESEYRESTMRENANSIPCEDKQELDSCSLDDTSSAAVPQEPPEKNGFQSGGLETKEIMTDREYSIEANVGFVSSKENSSISKHPAQLKDQVESSNPGSLLADIIQASHVSCGNIQNALIDEGITDPYEIHANHQGSDTGLKKCAPGMAGLVSPSEQVSEGVSAIDLPPSELALGNQDGFCLEHPESQACKETTDSGALNIDAQEKEASGETWLLRPCSSIQEQPDVTKAGCGTATDADVQSQNVALTASEREETVKRGEVYREPDNSEKNLMENKVEEHASIVGDHAASNEADGQVHITISQDRVVENLNNFAESELPAPEKLLSVPENHEGLCSEMLLDVSPKDLEGVDQDHAGSKTAAGRKRSFTESPLAEQSLNSIESSRLVRAKRTIGSLPADDDLLSSILVGRKSSILKVKPTPPVFEVTSTKRTRSGLRTGAVKRKVLMDDTMVLHGDTIRQQLTNTEDIRRVRKKAPCTLPEISMIRKQHLEDEIFRETIFTGISVELASLHDPVYDLSRIIVCQNDENDASPEIAAGQPTQNDENCVSHETVLEPELAPHNHNCAHENIGDLCMTSSNIENGEKLGVANDEVSGKKNFAEHGEDAVNSELFVVRDEIAETCENPVLNENRLEDVDCASIGTNVSNEQTKTTNDVGPNDSPWRLSLNIAEVETRLINSDAENHAVVSEHQPLKANSFVKNGDVNADCETEHGARDVMLPDELQDVAAVELVQDARHGELEYNTHRENNDVTSEEERIVELSHTPASVLQEGSMANGEIPDHLDAYQPYVMDPEVPGLDLPDSNEPNCLATGDDTDFLNVDDDELSELADNDMPDAEERHLIENSGWSSRTRAVSKYLQTAFIKERECGRTSLSLDNLLLGKSRKEASRMFFETLVLKTRDYIHVEQRDPFDDITLKPRIRLIKSDF